MPHLLHVIDFQLLVVEFDHLVMFSACVIFSMTW